MAQATDLAIARNRFGLGTRPDDPVPADPRRTLLDELERYAPRPAAWSALPSCADTLAASFAAQRAVRLDDTAEHREALQLNRRAQRALYQDGVSARLQGALATPAPFVERLVHFWANHFALSVDKPVVAGLAAGFEAEAIRPHVLGRFEDLLLAAERHPAMLLYLDQARSIGPDSPAALRANGRGKSEAQRRRGLNENLAREILELHTLGVRSGYGQADVTELARALTGWTIAGQDLLRPGDPAGPAPGGFQFQPALHEPGDRSLLGRPYPQAGEAQGVAMLRDLAAAPATARHLATKLARHFAGDLPPPPLVTRLETAYLRSSGDLPAVYRVLVESPEPWAAQPLKFKTPWEWLLSSLRALGPGEARSLQPMPWLAALGQPTWSPGSPAGWDDSAAAWAAPDALLRRVELAQRLAARASPTLDARTLAPAVLPGTLSEATRTAVERAESPISALALLLVSPEFLRR